MIVSRVSHIQYKKKRIEEKKNHKEKHFDSKVVGGIENEARRWRKTGKFQDKIEVVDCRLSINRTDDFLCKKKKFKKKVIERWLKQIILSWLDFDFLYWLLSLGEFYRKKWFFSLTSFIYIFLAFNKIAYEFDNWNQMTQSKLREKKNKTWN